jgi:hypothetical protein
VAQWFLTARASHRTCAAHHRPGHRAVTVLTVESAQAPVTAGRHCYPCRGGPPFVLLYYALLTIGTASVPSVQAKWSALTSCSFCTELLLGGTSYRSRAMEFSAPSSFSSHALTSRRSPAASRPTSATPPPMTCYLSRCHLPPHHCDAHRQPPHLVSASPSDPPDQVHLHMGLPLTTTFLADSPPTGWNRPTELRRWWRGKTSPASAP